MKKRTRSVQISMICWTKRSWRQTASSEGKLDLGCLWINTTENKLNSTVDKIEGLKVEESRMDRRENALGFEILIFINFG